MKRTQQGLGTLVLAAGAALGCGASDDAMPTDARDPDGALVASDSGLDDAAAIPDVPTGTDSGPVRDAAGPATDASAPACDANEVAIGHVRGRVQDARGAPLAGVHVNVCGALCVTSTSNASGAFDAVVNGCYAREADYPHGAVLTVVGLGPRPDLFFDFNQANATRIAVFDVPTPIAVPAFADGRTVSAPAASSSPVTLSDGQGFTLRVAARSILYPLTVETEALQVVRVPADRLPPLAGAGGAPSVFYAVGPVDTELMSPAALELPNVTRLAPGTRVEIVAIGTHASHNAPPIGAYARIDDGRVSADGRLVVADRGVRFLSFVGYRPVAAR